MKLGKYAVAILLFVGILLYVRQYHSIWNLGYDLSSLEARRSRLIIENKRLSTRLIQLESLARVEKIARQKLGMREPEKGQLILMENE